MDVVSLKCNPGLKMQHQQRWIYLVEWTRLEGVRWGSGGRSVSKREAETRLMLPVSCGHLSNYYLCCWVNPQSRAAASGEQSSELRRRCHQLQPEPEPEPVSFRAGLYSTDDGCWCVKTFLQRMAKRDKTGKADPELVLKERPA